MIELLVHSFVYVVECFSIYANKTQTDENLAEWSPIENEAQLIMLLGAGAAGWLETSYCFLDSTWFIQVFLKHIGSSSSRERQNFVFDGGLERLRLIVLASENNRLRGGEGMFKGKVLSWWPERRRPKGTEDN